MVMRGIGFCPGHITGFFSIHDQKKDLLKRGSRGAGVNLSLGALSMISLEPPGEEGAQGPLSLELNVKGVNKFPVNEKIYRTVLESLLADRGKGWSVKLRVRLQLPVGQGFGMSGAGALSTAISIWEAQYSHVQEWDKKLRFKAQQERYFSMKTSEFKVKPMRRRLVSPLQLYMKREESKPVRSSGKASGMLEEGGEVRAAKRWLEKSQAEDDIGLINYSDCITAAHRADILTGGGLGDVVAQARGGIEMRLAPGIPPFGEVHTIPVNIDKPPSVAFVVVGRSVDTASVLKNRLKRRRINDSGEGALRALLDDPTFKRFMSESSEFSRSIKLQNLSVKGAVSEVEDIAQASQVMIGNTVFAFVGGRMGADQKREVLERWKKRGYTQVCEIDLMGARPVN